MVEKEKSALQRPRSLRLLIVDEEPAARLALTQLCHQTTDLHIVGEVGSGGAAIDAVEDLAPDVMLIDVALPDMSGFDVLRLAGNSTRPLGITTSLRSEYADRGSLTGATVAGGGYFVQKDFNLGLSQVSGIDLQMNYRYTLPAGWGTFVTSLNGAYLLHDTFSPFPGAGTYDCAGLFGSTCSQGSVNPHWPHNLRLTWDTPWYVLLSAQWRFIGPTSFDNNSPNPLLAGAEEGAAGSNEKPPFYDRYNARIPGYSYLDLTAVWHAMKRLEVRAGVTNLLDKDPPLIPSLDISGNAGPANSWGAYDYLGRQLFVAFTAKF